MSINFLCPMKLVKSLGAATLSVSIVLPTHAYESPYEYEVDRFEDTITASYATASGCTQTEGIKGRAKTCLVINSTESSRYPRLSVMKVNKGWELLGYDQDTAPVIVTYKDGTTKRMRLPVDLSTDTGYGGSVYEWVGFSTKTLTNQSQIQSIEWKYGSAAFKFNPDKRFHCVAKLAPSC